MLIIEFWVLRDGSGHIAVAVFVVTRHRTWCRITSYLMGGKGGHCRAL